MVKLKIKPIEKDEILILNKKLVGLSPPHKEKLKEQEKTNSFWLIAWIGKNPVAHMQIRFDGSKIKKVKKNLKKCPHLEALGVAKNIRKKGIATKMIKFAENLAKKEGFNKIGLSVEKGNYFLKRIYTKRGYKDWKKGDIIESWKQDGKLMRRKCDYFVKKIK